MWFRFGPGGGRVGAFRGRVEADDLGVAGSYFDDLLLPHSIGCDEHDDVRSRDQSSRLYRSHTQVLSVELNSSTIGSNDD